MIPIYYEYHNPVKIMSGEAALENIPFALSSLEAKKPLLISDNGLVACGAVDTVLKAVGNMHIQARFTDVPPDSSVTVVNQVADYYRSNDCDSILAIGGGSVIDTAKGARMVLSQDGSDIEALMGCEVLTVGKRIPFIVVPTTAGTGSECTAVAVINNPEKHLKQEYISGYLMPDAAVIDVRMTMSLPPKTTASTGVDALCHAIEAYTCLQKNPMSDGYATVCIPMIMEHLPTAVKEPKNKKARLAMANASMMAGTAFGNSMVGMVHAVGHALGGVCHVPHGDAMSILLPHVMEYNLEKCRETYSDLLLLLAGPEVYVNTPKEKRAEKSCEIVKNFIDSFASYGLPRTLRDTGRVTEDKLEAVAETAINDGALIVNPRAASKEQVLELLKKAW